MNIPLSELRQFNKLSSPIVGHNTLPILDYVKFGDGKIVKSVLSSFLEYKCKEANVEMLVDERLLSVKVGKAQSSFLNISQKENKVTLTDSVTPTTFQVPGAEVFPVIPKPTSEIYPLSENFTKVISRAHGFSAKFDPANTSWMSFIMIGNKHVCASDGGVFFMEPIDEDFELVLDKRHAQIISKMALTGYAYSDKYMFFFTDDATIGFSKQEFGYKDIVSYGKINGSPMDFITSAHDLYLFNEECAQSSKFPWVAMTDGKVSMNDIDLDIYSERLIPAIKPSSKFTYNAETMNRLLSVIEGDEVEFYRGKEWYWLKSSSDKSTMLIMRLMY
jgi:hypothetical protein